MSTTKEINLNQYLTIFFAYKRIILVLVTFALALGVYVYTQSPQLYSSTTSVNFEFFNPNNPLASAGGNFAITSDESAYINTQIDLVKSKLVAEQVFSGLSDDQKERLEISLYEARPLLDVYIGLIFDWVDSFFYSPEESDEISKLDVLEKKIIAKSPEVVEQQEFDSTPWQAIVMLNFLNVENVFGTRIVNIGYVSVDRELAAIIANRFASTYIDTNLRLLRGPAEGSQQWMAGQLDELKLALEKAQQELTQYKAKEGIVVSAERVDSESTKLEKMNDELVVVQSDLRQAKVTREQIDSVSKSGKSLLSLAVISDSPEVRAIRLEIRGLEGEVAEKSSELGDNHPLLKQLKNELSLARRKLQKELRTLTNLIINREGLLDQKYDSLSKSIAKQKDVVIGLQNQFDRIKVLQSDVERRQQSYEAALGRSTDNDLQASVEETNVRVIDRARISNSPFSPQITKILLFAFAGAFAISLFIVMIMEFFWRKIRSVEDIQQDLGLKVMAVLPR